MATTPVSVIYLTPTVGSIEVNSNLSTDFIENKSVEFSGINYGIIQNPYANITSASGIEVSTNLPADFKENQSITFSGTNYSPVQNVLVNTLSANPIEIANTPISSTPTAAEQMNLSKMQVWSIG